MGAENPSQLPFPLVIMAPQGAEATAIARGLGRSQLRDRKITLQPIPAGIPALTPFLRDLSQKWSRQSKPRAILVMGVTGSLSAHLPIGQPLWVEKCAYWPDLPTSQPPSPTLSDTGHLRANLEASLGQKWSIPTVTGITVAKVICQTAAKRELATQTGAQVVDMENTALLAFAQQEQLPVAILRVISDSVDHDLPDLSHVYNQAGQLQPIPLAKALLSRPLNGWRLIRGSLTACAKLEQIAYSLQVSQPHAHQPT